MKSKTTKLLRNYAESFQPELLDKMQKVTNDDYVEEEVMNRSNQIQKELDDIESCIEWLDEKKENKEPYKVKDKSNIKFILLCLGAFVLILAIFILLGQLGMRFNFRRVLA